MKRLFSSEFFLVSLPLLSLLDGLNGQVASKVKLAETEDAIAAELDELLAAGKGKLAKCAKQAETERVKEKAERVKEEAKQAETESPECAGPPAPPVLPVPLWDLFQDADRALRRCGLTAEASALAQFYDNSFNEPAPTREYVVALLADLQPEEAPATTESKEPPPKVEPKSKATVNARMMDLMTKNPEARGWTCNQWASELKCGTSTVGEARAWKELEMFRLSEKAMKVKAQQRCRERNEKETPDL